MNRTGFAVAQGGKAMANRRRYGYSERQLEEMINGYFTTLEKDPSRRGGPSDLLAALHMDMDTAEQLAGETTGQYRGYGKLLREAATRLRAHLETSPAWSGSNGSKSVFLIKQQLWDGMSYADKRENNGAHAEIRVLFGPGEKANDAFG